MTKRKRNPLGYRGRISKYGSPNIYGVTVALTIKAENEVQAEYKLKEFLKLRSKDITILDYEINE